MTDTEPYVDAHVVAEHLGSMSHLTILSWAKRDKIPGIKPGKKWLFKLSEVNAALDPPVDTWVPSPQSRSRKRAS